MLGAGLGVALVALPGPSAAADVARCHAAALRVTAATSPSGDSHAAYVLRFENRSSRPCSLYGYPGVDAVGRHGHIKGHAQRTRSGYSGGSSHGPTTVVLKPHHYASAIVEWVNLGSRAASRLRVTAPNTSHTVTVDRPVELHSLQIHPVVAGRSGRS